MKTKPTKPTSARCLWQQGFRDAFQRLSVTLMLVMLTASAWAQSFPQTKYYLYLNPNYPGGAIGMVDVPVGGCPALRHHRYHRGVDGRSHTFDAHFMRRQLLIH